MRMLYFTSHIKNRMCSLIISCFIRSNICSTFINARLRTMQGNLRKLSSFNQHEATEKNETNWLKHHLEIVLKIHLEGEQDLARSCLLLVCSFEKLRASCSETSLSLNRNPLGWGVRRSLPAFRQPCFIWNKFTAFHLTGLCNNNNEHSNLHLCLSDCLSVLCVQVGWEGAF